MADLGDNGKLMRVGPWMRQAPARFASDQSPNNVVIGPILASAPYVIAILYRRGVEVDKTRADASGNFYFYDYDDSGYSPYTIKAFTRYGAVGTGEEWQVDIAYPTVTITKLFGASRGGAYFYQGWSPVPDRQSNTVDVSPDPFACATNEQARTWGRLNAGPDSVSLTVAGTKSIRLEAQRSVGGTYSSVSVRNNTTGRSGITYVRIA